MCPNSRLIVANIASRSASLLTSARSARLPAPSAPLATCSVLSFKPQMATRAPSRSNSCAVASPIPLLPPVIRIFLSASRPIVVTPSSKIHDDRHDCGYVVIVIYPVKGQQGGANAGQSGKGGRESGADRRYRFPALSRERLRRRRPRRDHEGCRPHPWRLLWSFRLKGRSCR